MGAVDVVKKEKSMRKGRKTPKFLYQVTILIVVVLLLTGLATFLLMYTSQKKLADKSLDYIIQQDMGESYAGAFAMTIERLAPESLEQLSGMSSAEFLDDLQNQRLSEAQASIDSKTEEILKAEFLGLEKVLLIVSPSSLVPEAVVWGGNDESLIYNWTVPDYILNATENNQDYIFLKDGVPELGLDEEYLVLMHRVEIPSLPGIDITYVGIGSVHEEYTAITSFYQQQRKNTTLVLLVMLIVSILLTLLVMFLVLNHLVKDRLLKPIEEFSEAAKAFDETGKPRDVVVRPGEEFEGLKRNYNSLMQNFRRYIRQEGAQKDTAPNHEERAGRRKRSILFITTLALVLVLLVTYAVSFFFIYSAQNKFINDSVEERTKIKAENMSAMAAYTLMTVGAAYTRSLGYDTETLAGLLTGLLERNVTDLQLKIGDKLREVAPLEQYGKRTLAMMVLPANPPLVEKSLVWAASDDSLVYKWEVPDYLSKAMKEGTTYVLVKDGVPDLGLENEQLFVITPIPLEQNGKQVTPVFLFNTLPMHDEIAGIKDFYNRERRSITILLLIIDLISLLLVVLIIYFVLNRLIKKQVTEPIEEVSATVEKIMKGDLDLGFEVKEGDGLGELKNALNAVVRSFRTLMEKATQ